jgi:EAL domain-containing protein (putative c-di-GMP-specific phosphodiesterase class I)
MPKQTLESWFAGRGSLLFQPIFSIAELETFAFEALTRGPEGTPIENAASLFELVRATQQEVRADRHCIDRALRTASCADGGVSIAVNVHPTTLERDPGFIEFIAATLARERIDPRRVIIEILEEPSRFDVARVAAVVRELQDEGVRIALDDVGVGLWNYRVVAQLSPDLLKVDQRVVDGCATDGDRRSVLRSITLLADNIGAQLVAEGIERDADLEVVAELRIRYGQGYLFRHPGPLADVLERPLALEIPHAATTKEMACRERRSSSWTTPTRF